MLSEAPPSLADVRDSLSGNNRKLFNAVLDKGDVAIDDLFTVLCGLEGWDLDRADDARYRQMIVGSRISYLNKRIARFKVAVKPGQMKRTYCLYSL